jgi:hypothetical protein
LKGWKSLDHQILKEKPEEPPSGFNEEPQQAAGSSSQTLSFYCILRLIARTEACPFCCWSKVAAGGADCYTVSAGPASGDRLTAAPRAGLPGNKKITVKRKDGIAKPTKVKKPTAKPKTAAGMAWAKTIKKTWMMHLQQWCPSGLWNSYAGFGVVFFMWQIARIAFFADVKVGFWSNFPAGDTADDERNGDDT